MLCDKMTLTRKESNLFPMRLNTCGKNPPVLNTRSNFSNNHFRDRPIYHTDLQIRMLFGLQLNHPPTTKSEHSRPKNPLIGRRQKLKMKEECDEILKQYGISGFTDF